MLSMATTEISEASFRAALAECADAIAAGDYSAALTRFGVARVIAAALPIESDIGGMRMRRAALDEIRRDLEALAAAAAAAVDAPRLLRAEVRD